MSAIDLRMVQGHAGHHCLFSPGCTEQVRAATAGVLGHQMAASLEQAAALYRKQRGAADRQLGAELLGREPGVRGGHGGGGCRGGGSGGGYPGRVGVVLREEEVGGGGDGLGGEDLAKALARLLGMYP